MNVGELVQHLTDNYGDHLPVLIDTPKGVRPIEEVSDERDTLVNDGSPFVIIIPDMRAQP